MPIIQSGPWDAIGDDNVTYQIVQLTYTPDQVRHFEGGSIPVGPLKADLRTTHGLAVNWKSKGVYEIVSTGVKLKSNDPAAP